jgi:hypothetical protein
MNGSGRWLRQVRRAFICDPGRLWSTGELLRRVSPRGPRFDIYEYARIRRAAAIFATAIRYERRGRFSRSPGGLLWRAKDPLPPMPRTEHTGYMLPEHRRTLQKKLHGSRLT